MRSKLIFLDVDGVINSNAYFTKNGHLKLGPDHMDPEAIGRLNTLVEKADADIVLSTSWRHYFKIPEMQKMLTDRGFKFADRIIGQTPAKMSNHWRGNEIQWWMDDNLKGKRRKTSIVILDDNADMLHLRPFLIHTNHEVGLTEVDVERALKLLENQPKPFRYDRKNGIYTDGEGNVVVPY